MKVTTEELGKAKRRLDDYDLGFKEAKARRVVVDFSEPAKANRWIEEMLDYNTRNQPRPAGIIGEIRYYKKNQDKESDYSIYTFLLSSRNNSAATTELLDFECRTPISKPENGRKTKDTFQTLPYAALADAIRSQSGEEKARFAMNVLRLIKGTSFLSAKNGLVGEVKTIDCALHFVALLLTSECLRSPKSKYLAISEVYKLKRGKIDIDDLFHPLYGRYIPARTSEKEYLEKNNQNWMKNPTRKSQIPPDLLKGGADQIRKLEGSLIKKHFYDEEMQEIYNEWVQPYYEDQKQKILEGIREMEKTREKALEKLKTEKNKLIEEKKAQQKRKISRIEENYKEKNIQKEKKAALEKSYKEGLDEIETNFKNQQKKIESSSRKAIKKLENDIESFCFSSWVEKKFKKAYLNVTTISNESSEASTTEETDE